MKLTLRPDWKKRRKTTIIVSFYFIRRRQRTSNWSCCMNCLKGSNLETKTPNESVFKTSGKCTPIMQSILVFAFSSVTYIMSSVIYRLSRGTYSIFHCVLDILEANRRWTSCHCAFPFHPMCRPVVVKSMTWEAKKSLGFTTTAIGGQRLKSSSKSPVFELAQGIALKHLGKTSLFYSHSALQFTSQKVLK